MNPKKLAAEKAVEWVKPGMIVGLGSGSTTAYFIEHLGLLCRKGLHIQAVATSHATTALAKKEMIPLLDMNDTSHIDLTIDGADEIDLEKRMIKGRGGAHVREKIIAYSSQELLIIVDATKCVSQLGRGTLPVEILFFGFSATRYQLEQLGYFGQWRTSEEGSLFLSDNGNPIYDITFASPPHSPEREHQRLKEVPGVVDTGFFFRLATRVIVGFPDGHIEVRN